MRRALLAVLVLCGCTQLSSMFESQVGPVTVVNVDAGSVDAGPPVDCTDQCALSAAICVDFDAATCAAGCSAERISCLETSQFDCFASRRCIRPAPSRPFASGPYGTNVRDLAGPVTLTTSQGAWSFADEFTGSESTLFLFASNLTADLFAGDITPLLDASSDQVTFVFGWQTNEAAYLDAKARWRVEINRHAKRPHWSTHVLFVDTRIDQTAGWVGQMMAARVANQGGYLGNGLSAFAIDRTQRIREVGMLGRLSNTGVDPDLSMLQNEARAFDLEVAREAHLASDGATVVTLATNRTAHDTIDVDVTLPDLSGYDTLEVDLALDCPQHLNGLCGAWDYLSYLHLCDAVSDGGTGFDCNQELARWITSYWREGRWVTDISAQLATLKTGGTRHLRWTANGQFDPRSTDYIVSLSLRFSNQQRGMKPFSATPLWTGGDWNAGYDATKPSRTVEIPADAKKVELVTITTGHGGVAGSNCAEFCDHQHLFTVNGTVHRQRFPEVQTLNGCADRVNEGVTPNQHGTWYYGRGGWCPGQDVAPWVVDVTGEVTKGQPATLTYRTELGGQPVSSAQGYIVLSSWLVLWK